MRCGHWAQPKPHIQHSGGENFAFTLRVVDVAGQESATSTHTVTRLTTPAPVVTIAAPTATLILGAGELLLLQAKAQLVSCNGTEKGQCWGLGSLTPTLTVPLAPTLTRYRERTGRVHLELHRQ